MNQLVKDYFDKSRPVYCAKKGFIDEAVAFADLRKYLVAFTGCSYQNPKSICAQHQMILPRIIRG
jgi:glutaconyl-CoA decarboxylase